MNQAKFTNRCFANDNEQLILVGNDGRSPQTKVTLPITLKNVRITNVVGQKNGTIEKGEMSLNIRSEMENRRTVLEKYNPATLNRNRYSTALTFSCSQDPKHWKLMRPSLPLPELQQMIFAI